VIWIKGQIHLEERQRVREAGEVVRFVVLKSNSAENQLHFP